MKLLYLLPVLAVSLFAQSKDEAAVRDVVRQYVDAREHSDPAAIGALFTSDADQLVSSGVWRRGRGDVVNGTIASSKNETGKRTITVETARFVTPDVALADGRYEIGDRKMWSSFLIVRQNGAWKIAAIRNMLPAK